MKKILIVEDDKDMHEIYSDIFSDTKHLYEVVFTFNVKEAIEKLNTEEFDLIILDIIMEPISGTYLYLKLVQDGKFKEKEIPVIIVSVMKERNLQRLKEIKEVYILNKPIRKDNFLEKINKLIFREKE